MPGCDWNRLPSADSSISRCRSSGWEPFQYDRKPFRVALLVSTFRWQSILPLPRWVNRTENSRQIDAADPDVSVPVRFGDRTDSAVVHRNPKHHPAFWKAYNCPTAQTHRSNDGLPKKTIRDRSNLQNVPMNTQHRIVGLYESR